MGSVPASSVPVGGGVRTTAAGSGDPVFVCQPRAGEYVAFSGVCTHAGCTVNAPRDGAFVCPCHDSRFDAATGKVLQGPATAPLARYRVREEGGTVHIGTREG
ncbi:ubiquinol-cytochrome c reductase iron-sulfur subunit [Streptacidiphilus monticola]|uniref:Cytochrome bc1 complex Rieske iron-sulfur subunit n=1 Tax=Streptacidiphilus monticola TaxID=2161674 RepID=A0ABW1G7I8_9ACTN